MTPEIRNLFYLLASLLLYFAIKGLTHPRTAVRGNMLGALGMLIAVIVTLIDKQIVEWWWIAGGLLIGTAVGVIIATRIKMTGMPEMVGLLNGFGGIASVLVAGAAMQELTIELERAYEATRELTSSRSFPPLVSEPRISLSILIAIIASAVIGGVTFTGSLIAVGKLMEKKWIDKFNFKGQRSVNLILAIVVVVLGIAFMANFQDLHWMYWLVVLVAFILGVLLVTPIGGADMPVVIALLNSYSGLAAAATGFVINNTILVVAGALVGASGIILTLIMCKAMNRSITNVLFGVMAEGGEKKSADEVYGGKVKAAGPEEIAMLLESARQVVIVPGYGMAVAQAQHAVRDLMHVLQKRGAQVNFGIHPVAGRMPGHMNVLLAEADVPYDLLKEMDEINTMMPQTDVAIVLGANDVVNPDARTNPNSPIAGMPIINVDQAQTVVVIKRSLSPGFAGIPNPLFAMDNTLMFFADGKQAILDLVTAVKEL